MKERSLIAFTILSQLAVGGFWCWAAVGWLTPTALVSGGGAPVPVLGAILATLAAGLAASFFHLGTPAGAWRACANLRSSWLSREILAAVLFTGAVAALAGLRHLTAGPPLLSGASAGAVALAGALFLTSMARAYRLRTVPAWNSWRTTASFLITALLLGSLGMGTALSLAPVYGPAAGWQTGLSLAGMLLLGLQLVLARRSGGPGSRPTADRSRLLPGSPDLAGLHAALALGAMGLLAARLATGWGGLAPAAFGLALGAEVIGRARFYLARADPGL